MPGERSGKWTDQIESRANSAISQNNSNGAYTRQTSGRLLSKALRDFWSRLGYVSDSNRLAHCFVYSFAMSCIVNATMQHAGLCVLQPLSKAHVSLTKGLVRAFWARLVAALLCPYHVRFCVVGLSASALSAGAVVNRAGLSDHALSRLSRHTFIPVLVAARCRSFTSGLAPR